MNETLLLWVIGGALTLAAALPVVARTLRHERRTREAEVVARRQGLHEPVTLHPVIDPERCIGTGACVDVCPEGDVLGFRHGRGFPVSPARCVGHGLCERSCPVEAITLVFGTATRGVELPRVRENYETNVPGLFVVGELGGMGLIRNAFEQGRQCVDGIARRPRALGDDGLDLLVVGCGPAGLASALTAQSRGLRFLAVDKEPDIGGTVRHYPRKKLVMTAPVEVPLYGRLPFREVSKEKLVETWTAIVAETGLSIRTGETVRQVHRDNGGFVVVTDSGRYAARHVVLAIGRRGVPRKLGVPGEETPKVSYGLLEPETFAGDRILVVGGGDAAVEAALALSGEEGTTVHLSYRGEKFSRIKTGNRERIEAAAESGTVRILWSTNVRAIHPDRVELVDGAGEVVDLPNDRVFVFAGGELPTAFLQACGVEIDVKFGQP